MSETHDCCFHGSAVCPPGKWVTIQLKPCKFKGIVKRGKRWYCRRHDPKGKIETARRERAAHKANTFFERWSAVIAKM